MFDFKDCNLAGTLIEGSRNENNRDFNSFRQLARNRNSKYNW